LCYDKFIVFFVEMSYFLSQQTLQKYYSQEVCDSDSRDIYSKCYHVDNDEVSHKKIHEVENKMIDLSSKLQHVALINCEIIEESC